MQCIRAKGVLCLSIIFTVSWISSGNDIPVEIIIGLPSLAIKSINGKFVNSPEPVLKALTFILFSSCAAFIENGVQRYSIPIFSQNFFNFTCCSSEKFVSSIINSLMY
jgi:hypothetical protein